MSWLVCITYLVFPGTFSSRWPATEPDVDYGTAEVKSWLWWSRIRPALDSGPMKGGCSACIVRL